jgi:hypothetical protein
LAHEWRVRKVKSVSYVSRVACNIAMAFLCVSCGDRAALQSSNPTNIIEVVQRAQKKNVRASSGEYAYQCFTELDYQAFVREGRAQKIGSRLVRNRTFMEAVLALRQMPESERQRFLEVCRKPLRPTWAQLGRVSSAGQTEAGQQAEWDIANAIVATAAYHCTLSPEEIEAAFQGR